MIEIYYIEDDEVIAETVSEYLEEKNNKVLVFRTLEDAKEGLMNHLPDILLMDLNMPDGRGDSFCRWIRLKWQELPIIFLTVLGDTKEIVSGFLSGADDYVVKPFELDVLYSRITALMRRAKISNKDNISCDAISIDRERLLVFLNDEEVTVSQGEYKLLLLLLENKGKTMTRERLLEEIWDNSGNYVNDNTLTVTMKRLREKLNNPSCLKTIRSFGYRMEESI